MKYRELIQFDSAGGAPVGGMPGIGLSEAVGGQLVRKSPEQRMLVEDYLAKFPGVTDERRDRFVELFPFHPDVIAVLAKIPFIGRTEMTGVLALAVEKLLDEPVPADHPGFIAADDIWELIRSHPGLPVVPEVEAVVHCSRELERIVGRKFGPEQPREMALRLVRVLSVCRLASRDIYEPGGVTFARLAGLLCLQGAGAEAQENSLAEMAQALKNLHKLAGARFVSSDPATGEHFLQIKEFKRFVRPELILHWVNAVPFLLLLLTGGAMLASRFLHAENRWLPWVSLVHEISAATWLLAMPPTVMFHLKVHWLHLRTMLTWGRADLLWFVQSLRVAYNKKAQVPPADRFNSGQKMNAVLVMLYFVGFGGTGLLMFFKGSILFPWYVHTALFFAALGSVGGHLFLALINPSTRIALAGIFRGWVPMKYVEHHHPLSLPPALRSHLHAPSKKTLLEEISVSKAEIIILAVTVLLAGVGAMAFSRGQLASAKKNFSKSFADSISPSQLSTKHRVGPPAESCTKCHDYTGQIPNGKCEECHKDIRDRRREGAGYHGTLKEDCRVCHKEHPDATRSVVPLDRKKFDHNLANFKLEGKHAKVVCDDCHKKLHTPIIPDAPIINGIYYLGLKFQKCTDCHKDPHNGQLAAGCEKCHTPKGWTGKELLFAHDKDSSFKLEGKHAPVECVKCHKPAPPATNLVSAPLKGLSHECVNCHQDPHRKQFNVGCETCHSLTSWKKDSLKFDHNQTKYPLVAKHADVACEKCHVPPTPKESLAAATFTNLPFGLCTDCHKDPHQGQFDKATCAKCHPTPTGWTGKQLVFDHNKDSKFSLTGKHARTKCLECHRPPVKGGKLATAPLKGLAIACESCHRVKHPPEYGPTCVSCHNFERWGKQKVTAQHILKHEIRGEQLVEKHLAAKCSECHNPDRLPELGLAARAQFDCATCHKPKEDPHKGTLGQDCAKCHRADFWKGESLKFSHDLMTGYPLDQAHRHVACAKCHINNQWKPINTTCTGCHPKFTNPEAGNKVTPIPAGVTNSSMLR